MNLGELREEVAREMSSNPVLEDSPANAQAHPESEGGESDDWRQDTGEAGDSGYTADEEASDRKQSFLESRTRAESLEEHLRAQVGMLDLAKEDMALAYTLLGYLDADGRFTGSIPDLMMVTLASEERIRAVLKAISTLDPPGCGAMNLEECLIAQLERIPPSRRNEVAAIIRSHLATLATRDFATVESSLGISHSRLLEDLALIRTLEPHPGRAFSAPSDEETYIKPEVRAVKRDGKWVARVEDSLVPSIRISSRYLRMLESSSVDAETRAYIKSKLQSAEMLRLAIANRSETIRRIAQSIFDAQQGYFESGERALAPLKMTDVAKAVDVHPSTVSRTVNGKYASTPFGIRELKDFFVAGVKTSSGEVVAKGEVFKRLKAIIAAEDRASPLADGKIAGILTKEGFKIARRTVAKYRAQLGIPDVESRGAKA